MQQINRVSLYGGGLNSDDSRDVMPEADGRERWNIAYGDDGNGQDIVASDGHTEIVITGLVGVDGNDLAKGELLGSCTDVETNKIYYFVNFGTASLSHIIEFDATTKLSCIVLRDVKYSGGYFRILDFPIGGRVSACVIDGKLFFTDGIHDPFKINIQRAKNYTGYLLNDSDMYYHYMPSPSTWTTTTPYYYSVGSGFVDDSNNFQGEYTYTHGDERSAFDAASITDSYFFSPYFTGYQSSWNKDQITQVKPPCKENIVAEYSNVTGFIGNFVTGKAFKFSVKYVYKDYEESVWSTPSNIPLDQTTDSSGESGDVYNCINVTIPMPNPDVRYVRLACCDAVSNIWYRVDDISISSFNGKDTFVYVFYGNKLGVNVPLEEMNEPYHYVPLTSDNLILVDGRVVHSDITEGRLPNSVTLDVTPVEIDTSNQSPYVTIKSTVLIDEGDFSLSPRKLATLKVNIKANIGWDYVPRVDALRLWILRTSLYLASDGILTINQMFTNLVSDANSRNYYVPPRFGEINDMQAYIEDEIDGTKTLYMVHGIRYYLYQNNTSGWNYVLQGGFHQISDNELINTINGADAYDVLNTTIQNDRIEFYTIDARTYLKVSAGGALYNNGTIYPSYKGGSAISVGIGYFDHALRYMPLYYSKDVFIPNRTASNKRWVLSVKINGKMPDYAEKYSVFQTESNIQDSTQIIFNSSGEAYLGGLTGDSQTINNEPSHAIENIYLTGISQSNSNSGILYWALSYRDGVPQVTLYKDANFSYMVAQTKREKHKTGVYGTGGNDWSIPGIYGSGIYTGGEKARGFAGTMGGASINALPKTWVTPAMMLTAPDPNLTTGYLKSLLPGNSGSTRTNSQREGVLNIYNDVDGKRFLLRLKFIQQNNSGIEGYIDVKTGLQTQDSPGEARKIISELYQGIKLIGDEYSQDEQDRYRFNISTYLNVIKKYNVIGGYNPEVGDYVRVLQDSGSYINDNVLMKVTKLGDMYTSEDGYFQYAYIYTEKAPDQNYSFSTGGVIELIKVKDSKQTVFYAEPRLRGSSEINGRKYHECDQLDLTRGIDNPVQTITVDAGNSYVRPRWLVKPTGDVLAFNYYVEDFRISDAFQSRTFAFGRINILDKTIRNVSFPAGVRYGGRLLDETTINNTCNYSSENFLLLSEEFGNVSGMVLNGDTLKFFQRNSVSSVYVGKAEMKMANGESQWVVTDKLLSKVYPSKENYGSSHPDSIIDVDGNIYFWDQRNGCPCKATSGGIFPLSGRISSGVNATDLKMARFFETMATLVEGETKSRVVASYSKKFRLVMFSFILKDQDGVVSNSSLTVAFHEPSGRWFSKYNFILSSFDMVGIKTYSLGFDMSEVPSLAPKILDVLSSNNKLSFGISSTGYFGESFSQAGVIEVNFNEPKRQCKIFENISLDMLLGNNYVKNSDKKQLIYFTTPKTSTRNAQYSYVSQHQLKSEENRYVANIPRDKNSFAGKPEVYNMNVGNELEGDYCTVLMTIPKTMYGTNGPDYSIREIDLTYSLFK